MAFVNISKPAGLSPVRYFNGAKYTGKHEIYSILAANANPFYIGDIVALVSGGAATAADANGIPAVTLATTGNLTLGAIVGIGTNLYGAYANPANLNITNRPTGAQPVNYYAAVSDDPNIIYEIQEGGAGTNFTAANVGRYSPFVYAAPATGVAVSGTQINNATSQAAPTDLLLMRLAPRIDNHFVTSPATGGGAQKWWVMLGKHCTMVRPTQA